MLGSDDEGVERHSLPALVKDFIRSDVRNEIASLVSATGLAFILDYGSCV
jgi:hypothetical protein